MLVLAVAIPGTVRPTMHAARFGAQAALDLGGVWRLARMRNVLDRHCAMMIR